MQYKIIVEPEALDDLFNIKSYITEQDSITKANNTNPHYLATLII